MVGGGGTEEGGALEGGAQAVVAGSQSGGQTLLAALWAQPPRVRGLESSRPPAIPGPLVPVWSLIPRQMSPHDPLGILPLRQSSPALQHARPSQVQPTVTKMINDA